MKHRLNKGCHVTFSNPDLVNRLSLVGKYMETVGA